MTTNFGNKTDNMIRLFGQSVDSNAIKELTKYIWGTIHNGSISIDRTYSYLTGDENGDIVDVCEYHPSRDIRLEIPNDSIILDGIYKSGIIWVVSVCG